MPGFATGFRAQAAEDIMRAEKFIDHMIDRGDPQFGDMVGPSIRGKSVLGCSESTLNHEFKVSESIRNLCRPARQEDDLDFMPLLPWYIGAQVEEDATVEESCDQVRLVHNDGPGLPSVDTELGSRKAPPVA